MDDPIQLIQSAKALSGKGVRRSRKTEVMRKTLKKFDWETEKNHFVQRVTYCRVHLIIRTVNSKEISGVGDRLQPRPKCEMLAKRLSSFLRSFSKPQISRSIKNVEEEESKPYIRKAVSFVLITITGGVALSALDDLAIYQGCSSKAMEKVSNNQAMIEALGEPIVKGPWYNASLAVAHKRHSVSCSFPVSGPQGTGILQLKAVRNGDDTWSSFFLPRDWEILIMDALLHVPGNEEKRQTLRIDLSERLPTSCTACTECIPRTAQNAETNMSAKQ